MFRLPPLRFCLCVLALTTAEISAGEPQSAPEAAPTAPPIERPALSSRSEAMAAELARQLPAKEIITLQTSDEAFVALWRPANIAESKGLVILLPGEGESADWPHGIGPLRRGLPDHGWHTLSVSLPDLPAFTPTPMPVPPAEEHERPESTLEAAESHGTPNEAGYLPEETAPGPSEPIQDEAETTEPGPEPDVAERIDKRIEAALAFARNQQPTTIILLGQRTGGYWAARFLQQAAPGDVGHLLLIQPMQPEGQEPPLVQLVSMLKQATGDFYYKDNASNRSAARERLDASRRARHRAYTQVALQPLAGDSVGEQKMLLRRVRGWLSEQP